MEIKIEFPVSILSRYNGVGNLDVTWDDTIAYLIHKSLGKAEINPENAQLQIVKATPEVNDEKLSYSFRLTAPPLAFPADQIVQSLKEAGYQAGLCLKEITDNQERILYAEPDCADIQVRRQLRKKSNKRK